MVYYRYLPTTQAEKGASKVDDSSKKKRKASDVKIEVDI